jgi:surface antigen
MLLSRKLYATARLTVALFAGLAVVAGVIVVAPAAYAGSDDYPSKWKKPARDSMFDSWGEYNRECTSWVAWRLHGHNQFEMPFHANADDWGSKAKKLGYTVDKTPAIGSVAWWDTKTRSHVAWVESVNSNKTVTIEEYNIGGSGKYDETTIATSSPSGYIHFQDLATSFTDGSYVVHDSRVYRMAGGAPIYQAAWYNWGKKPAGMATDKQWAKLKSVPADGTFLEGSTSKKIYRIVGGAPVYISSWAVVGGTKPVVIVPDASIEKAGQKTSTGVYLHMTTYPAGKVYVTASPSNKIYQVTNGAALPLADWSSVGGVQPTVQIGDDDIAKAGAPTTDPYGHLMGVMTAPVPTITGTAKSGHKLTVHLGTWTPSGAARTITWLRDGHPIGGSQAHSTSYLLHTNSKGHAITVRIKGASSTYLPLTVSTVATAISKK